MYQIMLINRVNSYLDFRTTYSLFPARVCGGYEINRWTRSTSGMACPISVEAFDSKLAWGIDAYAI